MEGEHFKEAPFSWRGETEMISIIRPLAGSVSWGRSLEQLQNSHGVCTHCIKTSWGVNVIWRNSALQWKLPSTEIVRETKVRDKSALNARWRYFYGGHSVPRTQRRELERHLGDRGLHICWVPLGKTAAIIFSHENVFLAGLREVDTRCLLLYWPFRTSPLETIPRFKQTQRKPAVPPRLPLIQ